VFTVTNNDFYLSVSDTNRSIEKRQVKTTEDNVHELSYCDKVHATRTHE